MAYPRGVRQVAERVIAMADADAAPAPDYAEAALFRLRRIEGQVRGLQRMIESEPDCEKIMVQIGAVRAAMEQVSLLLLDHHIAHCVFKDAPVSAETIHGVQQTLRTWIRYGAPAAQLPD